MTATVGARALIRGKVPRRVSAEVDDSSRVRAARRRKTALARSQRNEMPKQRDANIIIKIDERAQQGSGKKRESSEKKADAIAPRKGKIST